VRKKRSMVGPVDDPSCGEEAHEGGELEARFKKKILARGRGAAD